MSRAVAAAVAAAAGRPGAAAGGEARALDAAGWWLVPLDPDAAAATPGASEPRRLLAFAGADQAAHQRELRHVRWLAQHGLAPREHGTDHAAALEMAWFELPEGWPGDAPQNQVDAQLLLSGLGRALRRLHEVAPSDELDRRDAAWLIEDAARRVAAGAVDPAHVDRSRRHLEPRRLLEQLRDLAPLLDRRGAVRPTVTHGASRLGTVWLRRGEPVCLIGLHDVAVADPYRDLGAMARSLGAVFGPEALPGFFDAYGMPHPDPIRLEFHALLDELR